MYALWYAVLSLKEYLAKEESRRSGVKTSQTPASSESKIPATESKTKPISIPSVQQRGAIPEPPRSPASEPQGKSVPAPQTKPVIEPPRKPVLEHQPKSAPEPQRKPVPEPPRTGIPEPQRKPLQENNRNSNLQKKTVPEPQRRNAPEPQRRQFSAHGSKGTDMVDAAVLEKLEAGFKKLEASDSKSLLKKYLTREVFDKLKVLKTPSFGSTLLDVIQSGLENHDSGVGIYAPDAEAYTIFADLFDPIIEDYHGGFKKTDKHPPKNWGDLDTMGNLDPNGEYIISTRVRCGRSMEGYPFNPCLTEAQYKEMEGKVSTTLSGLAGELQGKFYPLTGMSKEVQQQLIDDHFLFKEGDRFLQAANACRFWPAGRGIYHNENKTFLVWCNEEDHLRLISMQMGGDLGQVYRRLVTAVNDIEKRIPFSHNDRLGFLTFCPTNLGTTVRASVHIKVPKLAANMAKLEEVAAKFNLQVRGTRGEHTEAEGGVYDISNKRRMGLTEYDAVKEMNDGIAELIKMESSL